MSDRDGGISWRKKVRALLRVAKFRPKLTIAVVLLGGLSAFLEGIGLGFIYPIIEIADTDGNVQPDGRILPLFISTYEALGIPFELEYLILGVAAVMTVRFSATFVVAWLKEILRRQYERHLRSATFERSLDAEIEFFDQVGSDDILNAIVTETRYSGRVIKDAVQSLETLFLIGVYLGIMLYIAAGMATFALVLLGGLTLVVRYGIEPAYTVGERVAQANERVQQIVQAGTQGIRDVKLFGLSRDVSDDFSKAIDQYTRSSIRLARNRAAIQNFYDLAAALTLFVLIYVGFNYSGLSLGELGIFLFAMFRLSPLVSRLNSQFYNLEGNVSHLIRTQAFLDEVENYTEDSGHRSVENVDRVEFDDVTFGYDEDDPVIKDVSFDVGSDEFVGFVGKSGAGKSTIVSLLARLYDPDAGEIRADGVSIDEFDLGEWRSRLAVVRQKPYIFDDTLENNLTVAKPDASREEVERVARIARVDEFVERFPEGYDTLLGDDGVRLSGGQRQRVALARALLKDADFLVLDEATSDLDSNLEREVQAAIESMDREQGIVAIAHQLSTVKNADRIYTMEDGEILERGTHDELLGRDGKYAELYSIQSR